TTTAATRWPICRPAVTTSAPSTRSRGAARSRCAATRSTSRPARPCTCRSSWSFPAPNRVYPTRSMARTPRGAGTGGRDMSHRIHLFKAKIHRATVTHADLDYEGSVTVSGELLDAAGIVEHEQVHIWNVTRGT